MESLQRTRRVRKAGRHEDEALGFVCRAVQTAVKAHEAETPVYGDHFDHGNAADLLAGHLRGAAEVCELISADRWRRWQQERAAQQADEAMGYTHGPTEETTHETAH